MYISLSLCQKNRQLLSMSTQTCRFLVVVLFDHFSDLMNLTGVKLLVTVVFFLSTFLSSTLPICLFSWLKTRSQTSLFSLNKLISCVTCFAGGIFLGACLLDLLPEVIRHINLTVEKELQMTDFASKRYPIAELLIGLGIFLVLFLEQSILSCHSFVTRPPSTKKPTTIIMTHEDAEETTLSQMDDQDPLIGNTPHPFGTSEQKDDLKSNRNRLILTRNAILLLSLIIHSVFEGIALGSTNEEKSFYELFFAIIIHKSIIAFSVGLKLMSVSNQRVLYCACALLSIGTPLGILVVVTMQELLPHNRTATIIHEILRAFACGTFFYITFFDILPHELNISSAHRHSPSLLKVLFIFLGFTFIGLLSFGMK
jgi:solute carrier family 39 (zinc transporter), member 1/2/3